LASHGPTLLSDISDRRERPSIRYSPLTGENFVHRLHRIRESVLYAMIERFFQIFEHLDNRDAEISGFIPTNQEKQELRSLLNVMEISE
jgi:hypothetical protein